MRAKSILTRLGRLVGFSGDFLGQRENLARMEFMGFALIIKVRILNPQTIRKAFILIYPVDAEWGTV